MRPFDKLDVDEKEIVRHQINKFMRYAGLSSVEVIPSIPTEKEVIPRAPAAMTQQENGWGRNEREKKTPGPVAAPKQSKKGERRWWRPGGSKAQSPKIVGAAEIVPKRRPELRGK